MEMDICFEGIGQITATFRTDGEVLPGMAVALTKEGAVGIGADGALPCGVVLGGVRGGAAAVQIGGAAKVGYSGSDAPEPGWQGLACDGQGGVKAVSTGGLKCLVLAADTQDKTIVVKL